MPLSQPEAMGTETKTQEDPSEHRGKVLAVRVMNIHRGYKEMLWRYLKAIWT